MAYQSRRLPEVTFAAGCIELFPLVSDPLHRLWGRWSGSRQPPFRGTPSGAIRRVMGSPCLSACRRWLLAPSYASCRVGPLVREGDGMTPDCNGVFTFRLGKMPRVSWPLDAGNWTPSLSARKHRLTIAPIRTYPPPASHCASRRFNQGFTDVQLDSDFSWHRFQRWLPTVLLRLRPA
jgi:hypothetical protein